MATVPITLQRLWVERDSGRLGDLCYQCGVDLLVLFGDALQDPTRARRVELAYSGEHGRAGDRLVSALGERFGESVHVVCLDSLDAAARRAVLSGSALLVGRARGKFNTMLANASVGA